jgi:hypothetical protein
MEDRLDDTIKSFVYFLTTLIFCEAVWRIIYFYDFYWVLGASLFLLSYLFTLLYSIVEFKYLKFLESTNFKLFLVTLHALDGFAALV